MNPNDIAPMVAILVLTVVGGAVILLRPISRKLGDLLEVMIAERRRPTPTIEPRLQETLERIEERLRLVEERQDFTDALISRDARLGASPASGTLRPVPRDPERIEPQDPS
jgi:hypothetical protein